MKQVNKKIKVLKLIAIIIAASALLLISKSTIAPNLSITSVANASGTGGPIVLDGMDPVCHAGGENTYQYIGKVLRSIYDQSNMPNNNGKIAILGIADPTSAGGCGGDWVTMLTDKFLTQFTAAPTVEFVTTAAELDTFFATSITSAPPKMIWIPDDWGRSATINGKFTTNAEKIADFVNSGGGLFSNYNPYGWLTALLPSAVFNNGGCNGGPDATVDGTADFGLTNTMVAACWHGYFTGNVGTLKTLVDYPFPTGSTRKAVSIGGGSVSLPSSFTLTISPTSPSAGTPLTITATAQTIAGVPQAGVVVSITVSSGPDAGQIFTATTNASGIATITINTSSTGTNVYTATATVNGVAKTVSTTVMWTPGVTTTSTSSTTTSVLQQTTTLPEVVQTTTTAYSILPLPQEVTTTTESSPVPDLGISSSPKTTVHDHSKHSHGILPETGSNSSNGIKLALFVILLGWIIMSIRGIFLDSKKSRKGA